MKSVLTLAIAVVAACILTLTPARAEPDSDGCKDRVLSRMPNFYINDCEDKDFDQFVFAEGNPKQASVEGRARNRRVELGKV